VKSSPPSSNFQGVLQKLNLRCPLVPLEGSHACTYSLCHCYHSLLLPLNTFCSSFPAATSYSLFILLALSCSLLLHLNLSVPLHPSFYLLLPLASLCSHLKPLALFCSSPFALAFLLMASFSYLFTTLHHPISFIYPLLSSSFFLPLQSPFSFNIIHSLSHMHLLSSTLFLPCYISYTSLSLSYIIFRPLLPPSYFYLCPSPVFKTLVLAL
jgi:hypothetical protein